ncbi:hypothetical protein TNCV_1363901 [Trichonephila clavipes]|uniref:Uncharacterized protein n=1 Tax=Trichonephila clavipes TaxID=2585209 RepID=A0A8X6VB24_TRICX|nr:hypothetical protein TNCV_1363901 [Trichonephila clavipes]
MGLDDEVPMICNDASDVFLLKTYLWLYSTGRLRSTANSNVSVQHHDRHAKRSACIRYRPTSSGMLRGLKEAVFQIRKNDVESKVSIKSTKLRNSSVNTTPVADADNQRDVHPRDGNHIDTQLDLILDIRLTRYQKLDSSVNPTPLAHADNQRDVHPRDGNHIDTQQDLILDIRLTRYQKLDSSVNPTPLAHADNQRDVHPRDGNHIDTQRDLILDIRLTRYQKLDSSVNPTPLAHTDNQRDFHSRDGNHIDTQRELILDIRLTRYQKLDSSVNPTPLAHADNQRDVHPRDGNHIDTQRDLILDIRLIRYQKLDTASKDQALKRSKICKKRSRQGSDHQDRKRRAPEQGQGVKRSIPSSFSSRNYKFQKHNTSSPGVESIAGPSRLPDRRTATTTGGSRMEVSGRDNQTRQTRATTRRRKEQAEKQVRSNQTNTRRPCPYYLRSRIQEKDGIPEELSNIEINGIPGSTFHRRSLSMEALNGDPVHRI